MDKTIFIFCTYYKYMNNYKNKGMYLEDLLNKTCDYYLINGTAYITKRFLPIQILEKKENKVKGILLDKSTVDYNGIYKGLYIDFEAKETNNNFFNLNSLKKHQKKHLFLINKLNGIAFLIIGFINDEDHFFALKWENINNLINNKVKKIDINYCYKNFFNIKIIFPGILDLESFLNCIR
ncbi:MAG: Holliday junction resolvase RecU [Mycoplasmoidaceae bacterium]